MEQPESPSDLELWFYKLKERFDKIYVLKDGTYQLILMLVFGFVGLVLSAFIVCVIALVFKASSSPTSPVASILPAV